MSSGDPLQADGTDALPDSAIALADAGTPHDDEEVTVKKAPVEPKERAAEAVESETNESVDSDEGDAESEPTTDETQADDAWIEACRTEVDETDEVEEPVEALQTDDEPQPESEITTKTEIKTDSDTKTSNDAETKTEATTSNDLETKKVLLDRVETLSDSVLTLSGDVETLRSKADESDNEAALTEISNRLAAIEKTGDDAMSKFGHAIGAVAERDDDLEDRGMEYAAEMASPSRSRESDVAPYIANAERELERSKSAGPVDIFDRIAQAAESQFDETRGSTAKRVSELVDDRRVGTKRWTPSKTMRQRMEKLEAARAAASAPAATPEPAAEASAASAPTSSTATMVKAGAGAAAATAAAVTAKADVFEKSETAAPAPEQERVVISRRDKQDAREEAAENLETASNGAEEAAAELEEDVDGLRVVPGARGRRRDRARKSRLDEDFEKIFDDEDKPSIGSLRRKLRTAASNPEGADGDEQDSPMAGTVASAGTGEQSEPAKTGLFSRLMKPKSKKTAAPVSMDENPVEATMTEEAFGAEPAAEAKPGFMSRFSKSKKSAGADLTEDELVSAFEDDGAALADEFDLGTIETDSDDDWEAATTGGSGKKSAVMPIIIGLGFAALGGVGFFLYKSFFGG